MRPLFFPFALAATAILAANNLLIAFHLLPPVRTVMPVLALASLGVAFVLWLRSE